MVTELARRGNHVIYANSRYRGNDSALIMEKVVLDLAAAIRHARERLGYERIVLGGWSGGGPLSLFYQQQAVKPTVRCTPAGDPPNLLEQELIPAEAILLLAAHPSRHRVLCDCIDPSILDESDPDRRDPELDLYAAGSPQPAALPGGLPRALPGGPARAGAPHHRLGQGAARRAARRRAAPTTSAPSSSTARWLTPACSTRRSTPTNASRACRSWATRASSTTARSGSPASAACAAGCRSGASTTPTPTACGRPPT